MVTPVDAAPTEPASPHRSRPAVLAGAAIVFLVVAAAQLFRQDGAASWRTVWAEDGSTFYDGTRSVTDLLAPHAGYAQLTGRLIGLSAHLVPIADLARFYAVAGAVVTTIAAFAVWHFTAGLVRPTLLRAVVALTVAFLPALVFEQTANGVNTLWAVLFAGWWALLYRPRSMPDAVPGSIVAFVAALSSGLALTYVPFAAYLGWKRRDIPSRVVVGVFGCGALIQLVVALTATDETPNAASRAGDLPMIYAVRVLGSLFVGEQWVGGVWDALGPAFAVTVGLLAAGAVILLAVRSTGARRCLGLVTIVYSVALYVTPVWIRGTEAVRVPRDAYFPVSNRFAVLSMWFLVSGVALLASGVPARTARLVVACVLAVQLATVGIAGYRLTNPRSGGPEWADSIAAGRAMCGPSFRGTAALEVVPVGQFEVRISCSELRD